MCFRPPGIDKKVKCPHCGKSINVLAKFVPEECPYCGGKTQPNKKDDKNDANK